MVQTSVNTTSGLNFLATNSTVEDVLEMLERKWRELVRCKSNTNCSYTYSNGELVCECNENDRIASSEVPAFLLSINTTPSTLGVMSYVVKLSTLGVMHKVWESRSTKIYAVDLRRLKELKTDGISETKTKKVVDIQKLADSINLLPPSQHDILRDVIANIDAGNPVMLLGPPGSGKTYFASLFLSSITPSFYFIMSSSTSAGIEDVLIASGCNVAGLVFDEVDKANSRDLSVILQLADKDKESVSRLYMAKHNKIFDCTFHDLKILALANPAIKRSKNWWEPLADRFVTFELGKMTKSDVLYLMNAFGIDKKYHDVVLKYVDRITIRSLQHVARLLNKRKDVNVATIERMLAKKELFSSKQKRR
ncbi:MAG: AAA family ATPase [Thermoproteus sp.]|nr:AAA family ATPase [Thermoproteus sp.]